MKRLLRMTTLIFFVDRRMARPAPPASDMQWEIVGRRWSLPKTLPREYGRQYDERLAAGHRCILCRNNGVVVHTEWLATGALRIDELGTMWTIPAGEACIYDVVTPVMHQGRGYYRRTLQWLQHACSEPLWIYAEKDNRASLHAIGKEGFTEQGRVGIVRLGSATVLRHGTLPGGAA